MQIKNRKVFVFIALCALCILIGLAMTVSGLYDSETRDSEAQLIVLRKRLIKFKDGCRKFPSNRFGLQSLVNPKLENCNIPPLLDIIPIDPWGNKLIYSNNKKSVLLKSPSKDGAVVEILKE